MRTFASLAGDDGALAAAGRGAVVLRCEPENLFRVFAGPAEAAAFCAAELARGRSTLHEVVPEGPQYVRLDLDGSGARLAAAAALYDDGAADVLDLGLDLDAAPDSDDEFGLTWAPAPAAAPAPAPEAWVPGAPAWYGAAFLAVVDACLAEFGATWGEAAGREDVEAAAACGPGKLSFHAVFRALPVADSREARALLERAAARLPPALAALVDLGVAAPNHGLRLLGFDKNAAAEPGRWAAAGRPKVGLRLPGGADPGGRAYPAALAASLAAAPPHARVLTPTLAQAEPHPALRLTGPMRRAVLQIVADSGADAAHRLRGVSGGLASYDRLAPSACALCRREHASDNTLMVLVAREDAADTEARTGAPGVAYRVVELCRRAPRGASRLLGVVDDEEETARELGRADAAAARAAEARAAAADAADPDGPAETRAEAAARRAAELAARRAARAEGFVAARLRALVAAPPPPPPTGFEGARGVDYDAPAMRDFDLPAGGTLVVHAQMGVGKTQATLRYVRALLAERPAARIVFVSFRLTFTGALARDFAPLGFVSYRDVAGPLTQPRLIVQAESLPRLAVAADAPFDLVVLDESESIIGQLTSGLHAGVAQSAATFEWLLRTAGRVLALDANAGPRTRDVLAAARAAPAAFHINRHRRAGGDTVELTASQADWHAALDASLDAGRRVVVATNSLEEARAVERRVRAARPALAVRLYSSETSPAEKAEHFGDVGRFWGELDVLIYTPTVSAGVSFTAARFDEFFGFFTDRSCDVETCRQMMARVRALSARRYVVCLRTRGASLPATAAEVERHLRDRRGALGGAFEPAAHDAGDLAFRYGDDGAPVFYETFYYRVWVANRVVENASRNDFAARFVGQVAATGAALAVLPAAADRAAALAAHRAAKAAAARERAEAVAAAPDIGADDADELRARERRGGDVTPADRRALERYWLRAKYDAPPEAVTADFVLAYGPRAARAVFDGLRAITAAPTVAAALRALRDAEAARYAFVFDDDARRPEREARDLARDGAYVHRAHATAVALAGALGFGLFEPTVAAEADVFAAARAHWDVVVARAPAAVADFGLRAPNLARLRRDADAAEAVPAAAAENRRAFLGRLLAGLVNPPLEALYGLRVARRAPAAALADATYRLAPTKIGALFDVVHRGRAPTGRGLRVDSQLTPDAADPAVAWALAQALADAPDAGPPDAGPPDEPEDGWPDPEPEPGDDPRAEWVAWLAADAEPAPAPEPPARAAKAAKPKAAKTKAGPRKGKGPAPAARDLAAA